MTGTECDFEIVNATEDYIYLEDLSSGRRSVTNDASAVIQYLSNNFNLGNRKVYYRDQSGRVDELWHSEGRFKGYVPLDQGFVRELFSRSS